MINWLDHIDRQIFLFFNSMHSAFSDTVWVWITNIPSWIPLYILFFVAFVKVFRKDSIFVIAGILLVILASDQFTSSFMKICLVRKSPF